MWRSASNPQIWFSAVVSKCLRSCHVFLSQPVSNTRRLCCSASTCTCGTCRSVWRTTETAGRIYIKIINTKAFSWNNWCHPEKRWSKDTMACVRANTLTRKTGESRSGKWSLLRLVVPKIPEWQTQICGDMNSGVGGVSELLRVTMCCSFVFYSNFCLFLGFFEVTCPLTCWAHSCLHFSG